MWISCERQWCACFRDAYFGIVGGVTSGPASALLPNAPVPAVSDRTVWCACAPTVAHECRMYITAARIFAVAMATATSARGS